MHVASLELCKELYELSGWGDTEYGYYYRSRVAEDLHEPRLATDRELMIQNLYSYVADGSRYSAYDLGYLFRKLHPAGFFLRWGIDFESRPDAGKDKWFICALDDKHDIRFWDTNVEDAACKLAIELFHQGVLKK